MNIAKFFVVSCHTRGWAVGLSYAPDERILTSVYRLSRTQRSKLNYLKVEFYRFLDGLAAFRFNRQYVIRAKDLIAVENKFREIEAKFQGLRDEIFYEMERQWPQIERRLLEYVRKHGVKISEEQIRSLKPREETFLDLYYSVVPLDTQVSGVFDLAEAFQKKAEEVKEYLFLAERMRVEGERAKQELREQYEEKIKSMERIIQDLKKVLREKEREAYKAKLLSLAEDAQDIAEIIGDEAVEDMKFRLEALKEFFLSSPAQTPLDTQVATAVVGGRAVGH